MANIIKAILFYITILSTFVFITGIELIIQYPLLFIVWTFSIIIQIIACKKLLSIRDLYKLSGYSLLS